MTNFPGLAGHLSDRLACSTVRTCGSSIGHISTRALCNSGVVSALQSQSYRVSSHNLVCIALLRAAPNSEFVASSCAEACGKDHVTTGFLTPSAHRRCPLSGKRGHRLLQPRAAGCTALTLQRATSNHLSRIASNPYQSQLEIYPEKSGQVCPHRPWGSMLAAGRLTWRRWSTPRSRTCCRTCPGRCGCHLITVSRRRPFSGVASPWRFLSA